ncbi:DUF1697 domain-containing protein [Sphingobacterium spiritivorum]|uniref:DUF1697 domain-containing protein n=1 Tax=Sphingobacterium spiritivorum TaxID=258 RepID=UPI003DA5EADA
MTKKPLSDIKPTHCAFLRGVNVKGTAMKMADVCAVFAKAGVKNVSSVLASGNILFTTEEKADDIKVVLEKALSDHFAYEAFLFVKNKSEIETITGQNPFETEADVHIYSFVGIAEIENSLMAAFQESAKAEREEGRIVRNNFYWKVPKGNTLDSEFGKILGRKDMKSTFTSRNMNTFEKILKKL